MCPRLTLVNICILPSNENRGSWVVPEVDDTFLPLPGDLLVNLQEKVESLTGLREKLPAMFAASQSVEVCLGPALRAAMQVIQHIGGKICLFNCTHDEKVPSQLLLVL